jgi:hypothetical protein
MMIVIVVVMGATSQYAHQNGGNDYRRNGLESVHRAFTSGRLDAPWSEVVVWTTEQN